MSVNSVVTDAGIEAAIAAGEHGPQIEITYFRLGSLDATEFTPSYSDTDVHGYVYQGSSSQISYSQVSDDVVVYRIFLDHDVGTFDVGNIGLFLSDGTLFAIGTLVAKSSKRASNLPADPGNRKLYEMNVIMSNQASIVNLTLLTSFDANVPQVDTEADLPNPASAPFSTYSVRNHTEIGTACLACRVNGAWYFTPQRLIAGTGETILATAGSSSFLSPAAIGKAVYYNKVAGKYDAADPADPLKRAIGMRSSSFEITTLGLFRHPTLSPYTTGETYYIDVGPNAGLLTTTPTNQKIGFALSANQLWLYGGGAGNEGLLPLYSQPINTHYNQSPKLAPVPITYTLLYQCPVQYSAIVWGIHLANYGNSPTANVSVRVYRAANGQYYTYQQDVRLYRQGVVELVRRPLVLAPGDKIEVVSTQADCIACFGTVQEVVDPYLFNAFATVNDAAEAVVYTATQKLTLFSARLINRNARLMLPATLKWKNGATTVRLMEDTVIPWGASIELCESEKLLQPGDQIICKASVLGSISVVLSGRYL